MKRATVGYLWVNGQNKGLAMLEALGYDSTDT